MNQETLSLLAMADISYDEYNNILPQIKERLGDEHIGGFRAALRKALPSMTLRKATKAAILHVMGVEATPEKPNRNKKKSKTPKK